jgi:hypothetical protein
VPPQPIRELRDLTRSRTTLMRERGAIINRIQKVLEDANIKLASVVTDILGVSGRAMLGTSARVRPMRTCWRAWLAAGCGRSLQP